MAVRVTREDAERIARAAAASKLDVTAWARRAVLLAAEREDPQERQEKLRKLAATLRRLPAFDRDRE